MIATHTHSDFNFFPFFYKKNEMNKESTFSFLHLVFFFYRYANVGDKDRTIPLPFIDGFLGMISHILLRVARNCLIRFEVSKLKIVWLSIDVFSILFFFSFLIFSFIFSFIFYFCSFSFYITLYLLFYKMCYGLKILTKKKGNYIN